MEKGKLMKENQQDNRWLDEIRNQMQDFEAPIPADGWERVSSSLSLAKKPMFGKRWMGVAASALLCAMVGGGYYFIGHEPDAETEQAKSVVNHQIQEPMTASIQHEESQKQQPTVLRNPSSLKKQIESDILEEKLGLIVEETKRTEENIAATPQEGDNILAVTDTIIPSLDQEEEIVLLAMNEVSEKEREDAGWSFGLHLGGHGSLLEGDLATGPESMGDPSINGSFGTNEPVETDDIVDSNHHTSWSFGLSVGRKIFTNTTLETGFVYTLLTSDVKMKFSGIKDQEIQYLGIPLKLNYQIVGNRQFQFYTSGSLMLERTLSAMRDNEKLDVNPWQWSTTLSSGGQLRVSSHLYLYLEPGVSWYFNADNSAPSLRTESPVYFNLRGGVRFSY